MNAKVTIRMGGGDARRLMIFASFVALIAIASASFIVLENADESNAETYTVYVSPGGNDSATGDRDDPFKTIKDALTRNITSNTTINIILLDSGSEDGSPEVNNENYDVSVNITADKAVEWSITSNEKIISAKSWSHNIDITIGNNVTLNLTQNSNESPNDYTSIMNIAVLNGAELKVCTGSDVSWTIKTVVYGTARFASTSADGVVTFGAEVEVPGKLYVDNTLILSKSLILQQTGTASFGKIFINVTPNYSYPTTNEGVLQLLGSKNIDFTDIMCKSTDNVSANYAYSFLKNCTKFWNNSDMSDTLLFVAYAGDNPTIEIPDVKDTAGRKWYDEDGEIIEGKIGTVANAASTNTADRYAVYITVVEGYTDIKINGKDPTKQGSYYILNRQMYAGDCNVTWTVLSGYSGASASISNTGDGSFVSTASSCKFEVKKYNRDDGKYTLTLASLSYTDPDYDVYFEVPRGIQTITLNGATWTVDGASHTFTNIPHGTYTVSAELLPGYTNMAMTDLVTGETVSDMQFTISTASSYGERKEYKFSISAETQGSDVKITVKNGFKSVTLNGETWTVDGESHTFSPVGPGTYTIGYSIKKGYTDKVVLTDMDSGEQLSDLQITVSESGATYRFELSGPVKTGDDDDDDNPEEEDSIDIPDYLIVVAFAASAVAALLVLIMFWITKKQDDDDDEDGNEEDYLR